MTFWKKIVRYFFKKENIDDVTTPGQATRFSFNATPEQVADVIHAVSKQKKIKYNPKLQYRKKKSQNKKWAKWSVRK